MVKIQYTSDQMKPLHSAVKLGMARATFRKRSDVTHEKLSGIHVVNSLTCCNVIRENTSFNGTAVE